MRIRPASMIGVAVSALLVGLVGVTADEPLSSRQATSACGCPDVVDMLNRLAMAEAAIETIKAEKTRMPWYSLYGSKGDDNLTNYERLRNTINGGMAIVQMLGANVSEGKTDDKCFASITQHSTACMDDIAMLHERDVHVPACNADLGARLGGSRVAGSMSSYADEEIRGYEREIRRIRELLRLMPVSCQPGWVGFINFYENKTVETSQTLPPTEMRVSGSERSRGEFIRKAKVLFRENQPSMMNMWIDEQHSKTTTTAVRTGCVGGLAYRPPDRVVHSTTEERSTVGAHYDGQTGAGFSYDPATGAWSLSFEFANVDGKGNATIKSNTSGSCNSADDGEKPIGASGTMMSYDQDVFNASGTTGLNLDVVRIEYPLDTGPQLSTPNVVFQHSGRVVFTFYKN